MAVRDRLLRSLPVRSAVKSRDARSKTGVVGVYLRVVPLPSGTSRWYCAAWFERGRRIKRSFSVARYGDAQARALAIAARRRAVAEIHRWRRSSPLPPIKRGNVGVVGVHLVHAVTAAGKPFRAYNATWTDAFGRDRQRSFAIRKYGRVRALALAIEARRAGVRDRQAKRGSEVSR